MTAPALNTLAPVAFDYGSQSWQEGCQALDTQRKQVETELALLRSPIHGVRFARFSGISDREAAIARLESQLASL